jgi:O-antigen/teichoic acid export membrane protein
LDQESNQGEPRVRSLGSKVIRSAQFSILQKAVAGPIYLLLVPFTLAKVGASEYGSWAVFITLITVGSLLDLGLGSTVTKYVAEYSCKGRSDKVQTIIDTSVALYVAIIACLLCGSWLCSHVIINGLFRGISSVQTITVVSLWPLIFPIVAIDLFARPFVSVINGLQRMDLAQILTLVNSLGNAILVVRFLSIGMGLRGLVLAMLLSTMFASLGALIIARLLIPTLTVNPFRSELATLREICSFSLALYVGHTMALVQGHVEKLYLAHYVGVVPVGLYNMASEGASKFRRFPALLLGPVMAAASELDAAEEHQKLSELYFRCHKYIAVVAVPLVVFGIFDARLLVNLWVGSRYSVIALPFVVLLFANFVNQLGGPAWSITVGRGALRPSVYASLLATVLNVVLSLALIKRYGFSGAVLGTALPMIISAFYFLKLARPYVGISFPDILRGAYLKPIACSFVAGAAMLAAVFLRERSLWIILVAHVTVYGVIYFIGLLVTHFFDRFDLEKAKRHIPLARAARKLLSAV